MYEFLEKLFGTDENGEPKALTFKELSSAIDADKNIKIVNLKDGGYISQEKYDAKETELKGIKGQLDAANEQIKSFEGQDIEGIKTKVTEWETKYQQDTEALKKQIEAQEISHQRDMYFNGVKFSSKAAQIGVMAEFDKQNFQLKDGVFQGADAWLEQLKTDDPASFVQEKKEEEAPEKPEEIAQEVFQPAPGFRPQFAAQTETGKGQQTSPDQAFGFNFIGVRKRPQ